MSKTSTSIPINNTFKYSLAKTTHIVLTQMLTQLNINPFHNMHEKT